MRNERYPPLADVELPENNQLIELASVEILNNGIKYKLIKVDIAIVPSTLVL